MFITFSIFCFFVVCSIRVVRVVFFSTIRSNARLIIREKKFIKTKRRKTYKKTLKSIRDNKSKRDLFFVFKKRFCFFFANRLMIIIIIFCKTRLIEIETCNESKFESMLFSSFRNISKLTTCVVFATRAL